MRYHQCANDIILEAEYTFDLMNNHVSYSLNEVNQTKHEILGHCSLQSNQLLNVPFAYSWLPNIIITMYNSGAF